MVPPETENRNGQPPPSLRTELRDLVDGLREDVQALREEVQALRRSKAPRRSLHGKKPPSGWGSRHGHWTTWRRRARFRPSASEGAFYTPPRPSRRTFGVGPEVVTNDY